MQFLILVILREILLKVLTKRYFIYFWIVSESEDLIQLNWLSFESESSIELHEFDIIDKNVGNHTKHNSLGIIIFMTLFISEI